MWRGGVHSPVLDRLPLDDDRAAADPVRVVVAEIDRRAAILDVHLIKAGRLEEGGDVCAQVVLLDNGRHTRAPFDEIGATIAERRRLLVRLTRLVDLARLQFGHERVDDRLHFVGDAHLVDLVDLLKSQLHWTTDLTAEFG